MRYGLKLLLGLSLAAGLAACSDKKPDGTTTVLPKEDVAAAENARSRITMVDAANGDAAAMPGEWSGPTAYDLRPKDEAKAKPTPDSGPDEAKPPILEVFPSVAE
jgi:hypothetical protein